MAAKRPNFLIVVADDLGFSDTKPYGSEIETPNLERLAREGLRMTDFHTAPTCSPTRAMLMSGTDNHIAGIGQMAEQMKADPKQYEGRPGYEGYLNFRVAALPEILQDAGYLTLMAGKWHLGMKKELSPSARGFKHCLSFLPGGGNHYNYEPQLDEGYKRMHILHSDGFWMERDSFMDRTKDLPSDFYSTKYFTDKMIEYLQERTEEELAQPFFAYLAYTAPHWPLQAAPEVIAKYKGLYDDGPDMLRLRRLEQLQKLGLVPKDIQPAPVFAATQGWGDMTSDERAASARKMEIYAAMVDQIDAHLGRLLAQLESTGELDNTFIAFMSDNGAEGLLLEAAPILGGRDLEDVLGAYYDNSLENMGRANSYVWYGPRWASAATAPSRGYKGMVTEGGIRCPCIVRYPPLTRSGNGGISHNFATVMDIAPTVLELAGVSHPGDTFRGRPVVPFRGKSWFPFLSSKAEHIYDKQLDCTGWELFNLRAMRRGDFKAVLMNPPKGNGTWQLFNLAKDPGELEDLAETETEVLRQFLEEWDKYFAETGMFEYDLSKGSIVNY